MGQWECRVQRALQRTCILNGPDLYAESYDVAACVSHCNGTSPRSFAHSPVIADEREGKSMVISAHGHIGTWANCNFNDRGGSTQQLSGSEFRIQFMRGKLAATSLTSWMKVAPVGLTPIVRVLGSVEGRRRGVVVISRSMAIQVSMT